MNRPYGAVDVAANLKGAVPKTAVQKIMVALAEKGELTQKIYGEFNANTPPFIDTWPGKTSFFVYNQSKIDSLTNDKINEFQLELTKLEEENKILSGEVKSHTAGNVSEIETHSSTDSLTRMYSLTELTKIKATLTDEEIEAQIVTLQSSVWLLCFPRAFHFIQARSRCREDRTGDKESSTFAIRSASYLCPGTYTDICGLDKMEG